jgi:hypothetical protein
MPKLSRRRKHCQTVGIAAAKKIKINVESIPSSSQVSEIAVPLQNVRKDRPKLTGDAYTSDDNEETAIPGFFNFICDLSSLLDLLKSLPCKNCFAANSSVDFESKLFSGTIVIQCDICGHHYEHNLASKNLDMSVVHGASQVGIGQKQVNTMCSIIGLPFITQKCYEKALKSVTSANDKSSKEILNKARKYVYDKYIELGVIPNSDNSIDIDVSYDGTWMKRGFTSMYGVGAVIDCLTGLILDVEYLSKYCHKCNFPPKDPLKLEMWKNSHKIECKKTFGGSSPAMEMNIAEILWKRSIETGHFRYITMLSDGDAKTVSHLNKFHIYGENSEIEKRECLNHVSKRLGTALRKIKETQKLGGQGEGKLTEVKIVKLTNCFGKAVRTNRNSVYDMKTAIFASLLHCSSTDNNPQHYKCPKCTTSWCFLSKSHTCKSNP